jgi:gluconate 2-dehydrogenase gamma chain
VTEIPPSRPSRRDFVTLFGSGVSAAWLGSIWPSAFVDAARAQDADAEGQAPRYRVLTAEQAADFGAVADRIIPRDDTPGARDVGVVFFADRLLASFAPERKPAFDKALADVNVAARKRVRTATSFAALSPAQQDETLKSIEDTEAFGLLRLITLSGYLSHPGHGGNRDNAGWKAIGFEDRMSWASPFGFYDRPDVVARLLPRRPA